MEVYGDMFKVHEFEQICYEKNLDKAIKYYNENKHKKYNKCISIAFKLEYIEFIKYLMSNFVNLDGYILHNYTDNKNNMRKFLFDNIKLIILKESYIEEIIYYTITNGKKEQIEETEELIKINNYHKKIKYKDYFLKELHKNICLDYEHNLNDIDLIFEFINKYIIIDDIDKFNTYKNMIYDLIKNNTYSPFRKSIYNEDDNEKIIIPDNLLPYARFLVKNNYIDYNFQFCCKTDKFLEVLNWLLLTHKIKISLKLLYYVVIKYYSEEVLDFIINNYSKEEILNSNRLIFETFRHNYFNIYCYSQEIKIINLLEKLFKYIDYDQKFINYVRDGCIELYNSLPFVFYYLYDLDKNKFIKQYSQWNGHTQELGAYLYSKKGMKQVEKYYEFDEDELDFALCTAITTNNDEFLKYLLRQHNLGKRYSEMINNIEI